MAKGKRTITIGNPKSVPVPNTPPLTSQEAEAVLQKWVKPLNTNPKENTMADTTHAQAPAQHPPLAQPAPPLPPIRRARKEATPDAVTDSDIARLLPNLPAELRNNEQMRKKAWYYKQAEKLGEKAAVGELSLLSLAENTLDGAIEGALTASEDYVDATQMYKRWNHMRAKVKPQTDDTIKNKARQLNWFIRLGATYGQAGKKFFNDVRVLHERCASDMSIVKDMRYTAIYENLNHIVRQQMMSYDKDPQTPLMNTNEEDENGTPIDNEAFNLMLKPQKTEFETNLDLLVAAFKALSKANEDRADNPKKNIPPRTGFHDQKIIALCQEIQDYASSLDPEDKAKFFKETSPKKRGKKKAAPADSSVAAGTATAPPVTGSAIPVDHEGEEEIPEGHYQDESGEIHPIPDGFEFDEETGELVEIQ